MKTAIVYCSKHHGNTKKLLDAIAKTNDVDFFDATQRPAADLTSYDRIGFASGIYYGSFHKTVRLFAQRNLPQGKDVFFLFTCGGKQNSNYTKAITEVVAKKNAHILGTYSCQGYNTYGPFKLVGGTAKGHPSQDELDAAVTFFAQL